MVSFFFFFNDVVPPGSLPCCPALSEIRPTLVVSMARALAAVDVQDFARHESGALQVEDCVDDVGNVAHPPDRVQGGERGVGFGGFIGDLMMPGATAFTRMPVFAYSIASDLVAPFKPPLVSEASTEGTPDLAWSTRLVVTCTIWPLRCFSISAMASCVMWKKPVRLAERIAT